jgi:hypothetical protein
VAITNTPTWTWRHSHREGSHETNSLLHTHLPEKNNSISTVENSICAVNPCKTQAHQQQTHYNSEPQITLQSIARSCKIPFPYRLFSFSSSSSCTQRQSQLLEKPKKTHDTQALTLTLTLTLNLMLGEVSSFNRHLGLRNCFFDKFPRFNKYWV